MHHKNRCVWSGVVDLIERRHPAFGELEFRPTSDHADPLRRGSSCSLFFQHPQCIGERRDTVPAQDRKSTRLNSSHVAISYAVFCLKKKRTSKDITDAR